MSKVLVVNCSARKNSNTRMLSAKVEAGAAKAGHATKTIEIGRAAIHPCIGCDTCQNKTPGKCVFNDDMTNFYTEMKAADIIVFSSPIYYFTVNAQTKLFIDRLYALGNENNQGLSGKQIGGVFAYGGGDEVDSGCVNAIKMFQDICGYAASKWLGAVHGSLWEEGAAANRPELLRKAEEFGASFS